MKMYGSTIKYYLLTWFYQEITGTVALLSFQLGLGRPGENCSEWWPALSVRAERGLGCLGKIGLVKQHRELSIIAPVI